MIKILTVCRAGLVRSVALANVLKLHFYPVDVIPCGVGEHELGRMNTTETLAILFLWADKIVVMEDHYKERIPQDFQEKVLICEVGPDTYGSSTNGDLIHKVWQWTRKNQNKLGIKEHNKTI